MEKKSMVFVVAALVAAFLIAANTNHVPDEIKAKKFVLVDDDGKRMVVLSSSTDGGMVSIYDKNGEWSVLLTTGNAGGMVKVYDETPSGSVELSGRAIKLLSDFFKTPVTIGHNDFGGSIELYDKKKKGIEISNTKNGGFIGVWNKTEEEVVQLRVDANGSGVVGAYNRKGESQELRAGP